MSSVDDLPPPPSGIEDLPPPPAPTGPSFLSRMGNTAVDALPMIGGVVGGALATPETLGVGTLPGVAGGAAIGQQAKNIINSFRGSPDAPKSVSQALSSDAGSGLEQTNYAMGGEIAAPYIAKGLGVAANAVGGAAKWAGTKVLSNLGGVSPAAIKEYAQFSDRINSAPGVDALKNISDEFVGKLSADVDAGKITAAQAQDAYRAHVSELKEAYKTAGYNARDAVTSAQQTLKDAHNARIQQVSSDVYDSVNQLKSDVQTGSAKALKTLDKSGAIIDTAPVAAHIDDTIAGLHKAGTDESLAVAERLKAYKDRLVSANGSGLIPAADAKKLIQGLDQTTTYSPMAGSFDKAKNAAFKSVRSVLDQSVKTAVPEYAKAMEPVAADADLLGRVQDFGDKASGSGILQRINAPNQIERKAALTQLGKKYGVDYVGGVNPANLQEHQILTKAQAAQEALRPDRVAENIDQTAIASRQKSAVDSSQENLNLAQEKLAPFKSLAPNSAGQTTAQQKLAQLGKGGNIELTEMFQKLGKLTDTDFVQAMKDQNTLAQFQRGATNGSRNTLMGGLTGWLFGGEHGAVIGGAAGRAVDQWGPAITKKILDGAIRVSKNPAVSTIENLSIPDSAKKTMIVGLQNYLGKGGGAIPVQAVAQNQGNRTPAVGEDKWAQSGLRSLDIQDPALSQRLLADPKSKQLLIEASNYPAGSKQAKRIMSQIKSGWGSP